MTLAYRIHKSKYSADSSEGAKRFGGRWNPPGVAAIYTAAHASLAVLEILVRYSSELPEDYSLVELRIPESVEIEDGRKDPFVQIFTASNRSASLDPKLLDDNRDA